MPRGGESPIELARCAENCSDSFPATEIAPTDSEPYRELAELYEDQRANEEAATSYEAAANRLGAADSFNKNIYLGRAARLRGRYDEAVGYFQKLPASETAGKANYEMGLTYVASKNRGAALEQYQELVRLKSPLAKQLRKKINETK